MKTKLYEKYAELTYDTQKTAAHKPALFSAILLCLAVTLLSGGCGLAQGDFRKSCPPPGTGSQASM